MNIKDQVMFSKKDSAYIKGLAVLFLLFHHNPNGYNSFVVLRTSARVLVWLFMFVTAYGFTLQMEKGYDKHPVKFVIKRLALIYFPMWIMYLINLAAHIISDPHGVAAYYTESVFNLPLDILSLSQYFGKIGVAGYWYVGMLFIMTILFPLFYLLVKKVGIFSIPIVYLLTLIDPIKLYSTDGEYFSEYLLIFATGAYFAEKKVFEHFPKIPKLFKYPILALAVVVIIALACVRFELLELVSENIFFRADPLSTVLALAIIVTVFLYREDNVISACMEWIGGQSGNIYYIHGVFYNIILFRTDIYNHYVSFILCVLFSFSVSFAVEYIKKKVGYNEKLQKKLAGSLSAN